MEFKQKKIRLCELDAFAKSTEYKQFDVIPISQNRINSYMNNPRANPNDFVLYLLFDNKLLVGFRTLLADTFTTNGKTEQFAWLSGSWVHPNYRRKGISSNLFKEVYNDWAGKVLYTNYAPNSKALYEKSKKFDQLVSKPGVRLYFSFHNAELLAPRHVVFTKIKCLLKASDTFLNTMSYPLLWLQLKQTNKWRKDFNVSTMVSDEMLAFIDKNPCSIFKRGNTEYEWIFKHPWVTEEQNEKRFYPFSHYARQFHYNFLVKHDSQGLIQGLALLKIRDGHLTIPYYSGQTEYHTIFSKAIIGYAHFAKAKSLTLYHSPLIQDINKIRGIALLKKPMLQKYFISKTLKNKMNLGNQAILVQDGDGDCIFT
jgi:GNAT superfamily N-acetyltransferase